MTKARNVVMPPLNTAGPIVAMACTAFSFLEPESEYVTFVKYPSSLTPSNQKSMANMHRIIHTQSNSKDNVYAGDDIDSDVPEVKKSDDIGQSDDNNSENHEANGYIREKYQCDDKDTDQYSATAQILLFLQSPRQRTLVHD